MPVSRADATALSGSGSTKCTSHTHSRPGASDVVGV